MVVVIAPMRPLVFEIVKEANCVFFTSLHLFDYFNY